MDASRLVFVSVKDAKPRRKIAVPIPDDFTWEHFLLQVQTKLKLTGIDSIYLVSAHGISVHRVAIADVRASGQAPGDGEGDAGQKYAKRSSSIRRSLQRFFPSFFQPGLPITNRDLKEEGRKVSDVRPARRRRRGRTCTLRHVVTLIMVLGFLAVLSLLYGRLWPRLP
ncbi:hypothetical protein WJX75_005108 [Coccomyxa subellipsoidea]|uniref:Ubiquitin-like domain-containing protein n=1 Tax=Coccomyxa subellipsoidea TaxID=248742 RepID=A0ABR2YPW6_9CHLO